jgi:hypothetical protein
VFAYGAFPTTAAASNFDPSALHFEIDFIPVIVIDGLACGNQPPTAMQLTRTSGA